MHDTRTPALRATYRVQLHAEFTFRDVLAIVPYLDDLGISHLYTSPIFAARTGSRHGYDVIDPRRINPELGTETELKTLAATLHERGMGLLVDIVPNHMSASRENPYWEDVLAHGEQSRYARWFDIEWGMHDDRKVVLPILSDTIDEVLSRGDLRVEVDERGARFTHFDTSVPISPETLPPPLQMAQWDPATQAEARALYAGESGLDRLRALLDAQHYRLLGWRRGPREINYRRFFDVNDLVALRAEDPAVHAETHELILRLVAEGVVDGLRVDHVDGLRDPAAYLRRLRNEVDERRVGGVPIVVEKILVEGERLRGDWPVDGTTGYERLNDIADLFVDEGGFADIERRYRSLRRLPDLTFANTVRADKRAVLDRAFAADVKRLAKMLDEIVAAREGPQTREQIYHGIEEFVANFPVYRSYVDASRVLHPDDAGALEATSAKSKADGVTVADAICAIVAGADRTPRSQATIATFVARIQQLTGSAMAKGLEDTAHYAYVPLVSRNEVGGAPDRPLATAIERFHANNAHCAAGHPHSMVATATHDTKRSGDVRARISALSELPDEWHRSLARWRKLNRRHATTVGGRIVPDVNAELFLYQTLVGLWPAPRAGRRSDDVPGRQWRLATRERIGQYMIKAVREAKLRTSWTNPDEAYERGVMTFVRSLLEGPEDDPFLVDVSRFASRVAPIALWNSLSRVLLHLTIPGTPDIYQGDELWNFALVDPDNRRAVDYEARRAALARIQSAPAMMESASAVMKSAPTMMTEAALIADASPKLVVTHRALTARKACERLFTWGSYVPLMTAGPRARNVVAFARSHEGRHAVVIAPRLVGDLLDDAPDTRWSGTVVALPEAIALGSLRCAITGRSAVVRDNRLIVAETMPTMAFGLFLG